MKCPSCGHEWRHERAGLTAREQQLVAFLRTRGEVAPSYQEMVDALGLKSKNTIHRLVKQLHIKGWIERAHRRKRSVRLFTNENKHS